MAAAPLRQAGAVVAGRSHGWAAQPDAALSVQGDAGGSAAELFALFVLPRLGDLGERLAAPGARMLDVGTGVGALAVGFAQRFPGLAVTGIDVLPRVLDLARPGSARAASRTALTCACRTSPT